MKTSCTSHTVAQKIIKISAAWPRQRPAAAIGSHRSAACPGDPPFLAFAVLGGVLTSSFGELTSIGLLWALL
jgi:hypothetical protein